MERRTDIRRGSKPKGPEMFTSPAEKALLEAKNGLLQYDLVVQLAASAKGSSFSLTPSALLDLQRVAIQNIYTCAGTFRTLPVHIDGTTHNPPPAEKVPALVRDMCAYVNDNWKKTALHLSSFIMWRLNWIHPFAGGNGRTSRACSYLVMCVRAAQLFPGTKTIPDQIVEHRDPYYAALDAADMAWEKTGQVDVLVMEALLEKLLAAQLLSAHQAVTT